MGARSYWKHWLGLPNTLIHHENRAFWKRCPHWKNLKTKALRFSLDWECFESRAFRKRWHQNNPVISLPGFSSSTSKTKASSCIFKFLSLISVTSWLIDSKRREITFLTLKLQNLRQAGFYPEGHLRVGLLWTTIFHILLNLFIWAGPIAHFGQLFKAGPDPKSLFSCKFPMMISSHFLVGSLWDFIRLILDLSMKVLSPNGKYFTQVWSHGICF